MLDDVAKLWAYQSRRSEIFPSRGSMEWFLRQHKEVLVRDGALLLIAGQWMVREAVFDAAVVTIGMAAARRQLGAVAPSECQPVASE